MARHVPPFATRSASLHGQRYGVHHIMGSGKEQADQVHQFDGLLSRQELKEAKATEEKGQQRRRRIRELWSAHIFAGFCCLVAVCLHSFVLSNSADLFTVTYSGTQASYRFGIGGWCEVKSEYVE